jgi:protein gp37
MATAIEWTDETWNPVVGCTKVSQGCKHCYAKTLHDKRHKAALAGKAVHPQYLQPFETVQLMPERLDAPLHWRKPRRVFVNSVSDLFHEDVPDEYIESVFGIMAACAALGRGHEFQILTKRPARMLEWLTTEAGLEDREMAVLREAERRAKLVFDGRGNDPARYIGAFTAADVANRRPWPGWPLPNVWLGVSVENQEAADERIPLLLKTPAAVRFLSCEPLLGPLDLDEYLPAPYGCLGEPRVSSCEVCGDPGLHWVIVGGESGPRARVTAVEYIRGVVRQCASAGVPCFVKQLGSQAYDPDDVQSSVNNLRDRKGGDPTEWPEDLRVREFPAPKVLA